MVRLRKGARKGAKKQWVRMPRRSGRRTVNVNRALNPIPQRYICKMKYADTFTVSTSGISALGTYRFNLNSIFDPNRTGVGHQPYAHDTLATLYNRYRVIKATYAIMGASSNTGYAVTLAALPANEEVTVATGSEARENPRCRYMTQGFGAPQGKLKGVVHLPSLVGRTKQQYMADDRYQAQFGASPSELAILNIYGGLIGDSSVTNDIVCNIEITYHVECFDVKNLSQS